MNRILATICVGLAGSLCLFGIVDIVMGIFGYLSKATRFLSERLGILPSSIPGAALKFAEGANQPDALSLTLISWASWIVLLTGVGVAIFILSRRKNALLFAKYWCFAALAISVLYVVGILCAPFFYSLELPWMAGYLSQKVKLLLGLGIQLVFVGLATYFIDKDLNRGRT
jgi:hypothetical protein